MRIFFLFFFFRILPKQSLGEPDTFYFWRLQSRLQFWKVVAPETKWFLLVSHLAFHINYFAVNVSFLLNLFFSDPADPTSISLSNGLKTCLKFGNSSGVLVLHPSHGHLIIFVKSLFLANFICKRKPSW